MQFEFATATRIVFGPGVIRQAGAIAREHGKRALVVTGREIRRVEPLSTGMRERQITSMVYPVHGEPELSTVTQGVAIARKEGCDMVISFGGGSVIDAGKAIAVMLTNEGDLLDYLEVIGRGKALTKPSAPFIAIPTTAGTGSEVTRNAVLASPEHEVKVSLRSPHMLAKVALVDPQLTLGLPPQITASTGLDALTQLIEPYVSSRANAMTDAICREGIHRAARSLRVAFENGANSAAREDMAVASLFGGLALANAGLGAVHGFAGPIGGSFPAAHGAVCAGLLAHVMEANVRALRERQPASETLGRFDEVARLLTGDQQAGAEDAIAWTRELVSDLQIPRLRTYGIRSEHIPELITKAENASSMKANPILLTAEELGEILLAAL